MVDEMSDPAYNGMIIFVKLPTGPSRILTDVSTETTVKELKAMLLWLKPEALGSSLIS